MSDLVALHSAIVSASDAVLGAGPTIVGYHPWNIAAGGVGALALGVVGFLLFRAQRREKLLGSAALLLALSMISFVGCVVALGCGLFLGVPREGATVAMLQARGDACNQMMDAIQVGDVRWMEPTWQRDVSVDCGSERLAAAANAPSSRFASKM